MTDHPPHRRGRRRRTAAWALVAVLTVGAVVWRFGPQADRTDANPISPPAGSVRTVPFDPSRRPSPGRSSWTPWPQALHDARHSGSSTVTGPRRGVVAWHRHLSDGAVPGGPVLGRDGTIYVVDSGGTLHAVRPEDGKDRWSVDTGAPVSGDLSVSPLVLPDGDVVAGTGEGLAAWSPAGKRRWAVPLGDSLTSPTTVDGRRIYVGSTSGQLYAVDVGVGTAARAWRLDLGIGQSYGSVVADGKGRIYQTSTVGVVAVDDDNGRPTIAWRTDAHDGLVEVSPGLSPTGTVLLGTNGEQEWAYRRDGTVLWKAPRNITYSSPSVTEDGLAYVGEHNDRVHVFDVADGREVGLFPTTVTEVDGKTRVWTSVVVDATHAFFFATRTHYLVGVRPDGTRLFTTDLGASTSSYPALTGDHAVVIGTDDGDLVKVH
ncbi:MAG: PQQ-binding-like beta-propeller repeat protein [Nocardioidaceae bacterium]